MPPAAEAPTAATDRPDLEAVSRCVLLFGRVLLQNGGDTGQVQLAVRRFAAALGYEANLLVSYEALLLTLARGDVSTTRIGHRIPAMNVEMDTLARTYRVLDGVEAGALGLAAAQAALDRLEHQPPVYNRWLVAVALGVTAGSLSRLFGGDWAAFVVCWVAAMLGTLLRQDLGRRGLSPVLVAFATACVSGILGGFGARLLASATPALCLVAPGMVIVPGVPLINGVQDMIRNHASTGIARIGFALFVMASIGLGLEVASFISGVALPLEFASRPVPVAEDAVFAALAALGFVCLFSIPRHLAWACALCGVGSHTVRTILMHLGLDMVSGTVVGALVAAGLAVFFAQRLRTPASTFAFPGVVAMIPSVYGFRAVAGAMRIVDANLAPPPALVDTTAALAATVVLITAAITVGIAVPLALTAPRTASRRLT